MNYLKLIPIFMILLFRVSESAMPVHTALELSSMVSWLQKFLETPDSMQVEDFMIVTGSETKAMITRGKSIKYVLLTLWHNSSTRPTVLEFNKCLKTILPIYSTTVELNAKFDKILNLNPPTIERAPYLFTQRAKSILPVDLHAFSEQDLEFLIKFNSVYWPKIINAIIALIRINNNVGIDGKITYETYFTKLLEILIRYVKKHKKAPVANLMSIQNYVNALNSAIKLNRIDRNHLVTLANETIDYIKKINNFIHKIGENYVTEKNAGLGKHVHELLRLTGEFTMKWTELDQAIQTFDEQFIGETYSKRYAAIEARNSFLS